MPDTHIRPSGGAEVTFDPAELFFSRTNSNGVIRSGNDVFQRISGYPWDALLGAPHNIIRHPDMPEGVFSLLSQGPCARHRRAGQNNLPPANRMRFNWARS